MSQLQIIWKILKRARICLNPGANLKKKPAAPKAMRIPRVGNSESGEQPIYSSPYFYVLYWLCIYQRTSAITQNKQCLLITCWCEFLNIMDVYLLVILNRQGMIENIAWIGRSCNWGLGSCRHWILNSDMAYISQKTCELFIGKQYVRK